MTLLNVLVRLNECTRLASQTPDPERKRVLGQMEKLWWALADMALDPSIDVDTHFGRLLNIHRLCIGPETLTIH